MTKELGRRLRDLRERAGLTQTELAKLSGCGWAHSLVSKLEAGCYANPGLGLVADYLRTCRASFADLADLLNAYTSKPRPVEQRGLRAVAKVSADLPAKTANAVLKYDIKTTLARRASGEQPLSPEERVRRVLNLAAAASRRKRMDILVKHLLDEVGPGFSFTERQFVDRYARKVWGALTSTRGQNQRLRVRRLARVFGDGIVAHVLPEAKVRLVRDRVVELFRAMEMTGGLATIPRPARPGPKRKPLEPKPGTLTPAMIAREANISEGLGAVMAAIQTKGRPAGEAVTWYTWLTLLASAAYDTQPGSPEREQVLTDALKDQPDPSEARKFAELALDGLDRQLRRK
jgi:transcriptional regulator with XRE-family HTH domain